MTLLLGDYREVLAGETWDACIMDAPYSERTHSGHDASTDSAGVDVYNGKPSDRTPDRGRRALGYGAWSADDVRACVEFVAPRTRGWIVSITDHVLAPAWCDAMEAAGRYTFAPLPWVGVASRCRLSGDGPSSWTCWVIVSRPKSREFQRWGTLPGAYITHSKARDVVIGAKPLDLMRDIIRDYTRPGDRVCDPCAGGGTTLRAARAEGRGWIGAERDPDTWRVAADRLDVERDTTQAQARLW